MEGFRSWLAYWLGGAGALVLLGLVRKPLVLGDDGLIQQLQAGDALAGYAQTANNLSDLASADAALTNLGFRARHVITDAATVTVNATLGRQQEVTLGGNRTIAFAGWVDGDEVKLDLVQDGTGSRTLTWPAVRWAGGSAPTLTTTAGKWDTVVIRRRGTDYAGYLAGSNI